MNAAGKVSLAGFSYRAGPAYAGEPVEVVAAEGLVEILHAGVVIATHAQRFREDQADRAPRAPVTRRARDATAGLTVTRLASAAGVVSFAGTDYQAGRAWARQPIDVSIVAGSVQLSRDGTVIRVHPIRHDRSRELGAFANPKGRPRRKNSAAGTVAHAPEPALSPGYPNLTVLCAGGPRWRPGQRLSRQATPAAPGMRRAARQTAGPFW